MSSLLQTKGAGEDTGVHTGHLPYYSLVVKTKVIWSVTIVKVSQTGREGEEGKNVAATETRTGSVERGTTCSQAKLHL